MPCYQVAEFSVYDYPATLTLFNKSFMFICVFFLCDRVRDDDMQMKIARKWCESGGKIYNPSVCFACTLIVVLFFLSLKYRRTRIFIVPKNNRLTQFIYIVSLFIYLYTFNFPFLIRCCQAFLLNCHSVDTGFFSFNILFLSLPTINKTQRQYFTDGIKWIFNSPSAPEFLEVEWIEPEMYFPHSLWFQCCSSLSFGILSNEMRLKFMIKYHEPWSQAKANEQYDNPCNMWR